MGSSVRRHLIAASLGAALVFAVLGCGLLKLSYYRIGSGSMEPDFPVGTILIDSSALPIEPHRAVTFAADDAVVTHVLLGYNHDGSLITRGTASAANDRWRTPVFPRDIRGRVLFRILLFAPVFWASLHGIELIAGLSLAAVAVVLWRHSGQQTHYSRLQSSSK